MRLIDRLNMAQRVVVVIAIGIALAVAGGYLVSLGGGLRAGWYAYAPLQAQPTLPGMGLPDWLRMIVWLGLTGIWALVSVLVLRPPKGPAAPR